MEYLVEDIEILKDVVNIKLKSNMHLICHKIHAVAFANYYISVGKYISNEYLLKILEESKYYNLKDEVIKKLKNKDYTRGEIIIFLEDKLDEYSIDRMIKDLEKNNYINDYNYLKKVFELANNKLKGKNYIKKYLENKYLDEKLLDSFFVNFKENELANKLVKGELNKLKGKYSKQAILSKISYKLNYNGFSEFVIQDIIDGLQYLKFNNNEEIIVKECKKYLKKYENKLENNDLMRKVIETLVAKGYNYKSVKTIIEGMINDD